MPGSASRFAPVAGELLEGLRDDTETRAKLVGNKANIVDAAGVDYAGCIAI